MRETHSGAGLKLGQFSCEKGPGAPCSLTMKSVEFPPAPLRGAQVWPVSLDAYHTLGETGLIPKNAELLYGLVYTKVSKSPLHSFLVVRLLRLLESAIRPGQILRSEQPITCEDSEPEPDISVVCGGEEDFMAEHPRTAEFVAEVCVSSRDYDQLKLRAYACAGVKECWFVLGRERKIEAYSKPKDGVFTEHKVFGPGDTILSSGLPDFRLNLDVFFPGERPTTSG